MKEVNDRSGPIWSLPKGVGKQNCLTIHCPLSNWKKFLTTPGPPPPLKLHFPTGTAWAWVTWVCLSILKFVLDEKRSMIIRLAGLGSKKLKFSFCTYSNDPNSRKIKENLRKLNKKRIDLVEIILECSGWGRSPIARTVSTGGPPVACSSCSPGPRSGRSYCTWLYSLNKKNVTSGKNHF